MNGTQKIAGGLAVLGALGFAVYSQAKKDKALGTVTADKADLPELKGSDDLDKIVITNADKGTVTLEKQGDANTGKWMVTAPVKAPANQSNVKSLLDNWKEVKAVEMINGAPTDELKKSYALDEKQAVHVVGYKGGEKKVDDTFGKAGSLGQVVMTEGKPGIYIAKGYSGYLYGREVKNWRDTEIFKFEDANVVSMTIDKAAGTTAGGDGGTKKTEAGTFSFSKNGDKWSGTWNGKPIEKFDEEKVKDALRTFKNLSADDFADGKSAAETGLDAPVATLSFTLKDNAGKHVLKVGKSAAGTTRYAKKDGDETLFIIPGSAAEWATVEPSKFVKPADAGAAKPSTPEHMDGMPGMGGMPPGMGGMPAGHPHME